MESHHACKNSEKRSCSIAISETTGRQCFPMIPQSYPVQQAVLIHGGFLSHRATPSHHPFIDGIFPWKLNHSAIKGYPHDALETSTSRYVFWSLPNTNCRGSLQMKGGKLIWTWTEKGTNQSDAWPSLGWRACA